MGRKKRGNPVHGWVILDKPEGMTSTQAVGKIRYIFQAQKAGHGGTLDPLASGILPIALGEATKTAPFVMDGEKIYRFQVFFGQSRTTDDREGDIVATSDVLPTLDEIKTALPAFIGTIEQKPPAYSAIKIDGKRAYDLARADQAPEMKARPVTIHDLTCDGMPEPHLADFTVTCGKGTYVRSLARDLAEALGSCGHVSLLRRIKCASFTEKDAFSLEKLEELGHSAPDSDGLLPVITALDDIPALAVSADEARRLYQGQALSFNQYRSELPNGIEKDEQVFLIKTETTPVAIGTVKGTAIRPKRVLLLNDT